MSQAGDRMTADSGKAQGFTLIELLVVMTLVALIAALATPMAGRLVPGLELRSAADSLGTELRRARSVARRDNREAAVLIDVASGSFRGQDATQAEFLPRGVAVEFVTASRERIDEHRGLIRFYPDGTSTGGTIRLQRETASYELVVDWFDGTVRVNETEAR